MIVFNMWIKTLKFGQIPLQLSVLITVRSARKTTNVMSAKSHSISTNMANAVSNIGIPGTGLGFEISCILHKRQST